VLALTLALALAPFGHQCTLENGVRFCPTATDAQRVPSWDRVPLDVDVTLPARGKGPFPTIVMMHGWGGDKSSFETNAPLYSNNYFAKQGYAVITPSARGFGRSCGAMSSRTSPGCDRGFVRLADQRYEGRDVQYLLGRLVDQKIVNPDEIGVTGISYGGIQSLNLARLRDRIRLPNGSYKRWRSPKGTPLSIAAAWPRWGGSDMTYALQPNGRFLDFRPYRVGQSADPLGVQKQSYVSALYGAGAGTGFYATTNAPFDANLPLWKQVTDAGEPATAQGLRIARELTAHHSIAGLSGVPAPLLVENGWTDDLFPAEEALRVWRMFRHVRGARVTLQLGDLGHPRGANKPAVDQVLNTQGVKFFSAYLKGAGRGPRPGSVTAFTQTCPADAPAGGPFHARSWEALAPDRVRFSAARTQRVTSSGGDPSIGAAINPIGGKPPCEALPAADADGTATASRRIDKPFTMIGMPTVRARIKTTGRGGMLAARLWDVHDGRQLLVSRGIYRLDDNQKGKVVFQLFGNGWRFARGHTAKLEVTGSDPTYVRPSNFDFSVRVSGLSASLPK
jgi:pimeloyl-ACP methyl ester carboxylesterase